MATQETRAELIEIVVAMFDAAPGVAVLSDLEAASDAGNTNALIAASLANSLEFKGIFPPSPTNFEFVSKFVDQMVGSLVLEAEKTEVKTALTAEMNAGATRVDVVLTAVAALKATPTDDAVWGNASAAFANKVEVATYHTVEKQQATTTLADLQAELASVDNTAASVTSAKAELDDEEAAAETFTLTESAAQAQYELDTTTLTAGTSSYIALELAAAEAAEAAIAAGATQAEIDDALAEIVAVNAASLTLAQIVALADENTAVTEALAAVDTDVVEAAGDAATVPEVDAQIATNFTAYNALTDHDAAALTDITDPGDLGNASFSAPAANVVADIHAANVAALNSKITISTAELAVEQANVDAIVGLETAYDAALAAATAYETAFAVDAATSDVVAAAKGAYDAVLAGAAVLNADGTVSDASVAAIAETTAGDSSAIAEVQTVTFGGLAAGQSVTIDEITVTATNAMTDAEVGAAFETAYAANGDAGWVADDQAGATLTMTSTDAGFADEDMLVATIGGTHALTAAVVAAHAADVAAQADLADAADVLEDAVLAIAQTAQDAVDDTVTITTGDYTDPVTLGAEVAFDFSTGADAAYFGDVDGFISAQEDLEAANDAMTDFVDAKADIDAVLAIANTLEPLLEAQTDAADDLVGEVTLADADALTGNAAQQDVYFIDELVAGDSATLSGDAVNAVEDYIFIGTDYTVNTDLATGDNAVLEMFITEGTTADDTLLTFETKVFGSDSAGDFFTVELTGVATTDVVVDSGLITFA